MRGVGELTVNGDDRSLAVVAHASVAFGLLGVGSVIGPIVNLVIWLRSRGSPVVAIHAEQAGLYQLVLLAINALSVILWLVMLLNVFMGESTIGPGQMSLRQIAAGLWLALIPLFIIWYLASIGYGIYGAMRVASGRPFWYPLIGARVRRRYQPSYS